jgi:hypothetical protein
MKLSQSFLLKWILLVRVKMVFHAKKRRGMCMLKKGSEKSRCTGAFQTAQLELSSLSQDDTRGDLATHLSSNLVEIWPLTLSSIQFPPSAQKGETLQGNTSQLLSFGLRKKRQREEKRHEDRLEIT